MSGRGLWLMEGGDVERIGQRPGGHDFAAFVDALLRAHAHAHGVPMGAIDTMWRTDVADAGVDARVSEGAAGDTSGWMRQPTTWQYKAAQARNLDKLREKFSDEIAKPAVREDLLAGFAYRYSVASAMTARRKRSWSAKLTELVRAVNPAAPEAEVLTADDLAAWACSYPALAARFLDASTSTRGLHFAAWGESVTAGAEHFVAPPGWEAARERIAAHADLATRPADLILAVAGEAGVGKARAVYEALLAAGGARHLVLYTDEEVPAREVARHVAGDATLRLILVVDGGDAGTREGLRRILRGREDRVRIIVIDNTALRPGEDEGARFLWLPALPEATVSAILGANTPEIPPDSRRSYAHLAGGSARLALDIARHHGLIATAGRVGPALGSIREYLDARLGAEERTTLATLAVVRRVGARGDVAAQLIALCTAIAEDPARIRAVAAELRDGPGFAARAGRFLLVAPPVVAEAAFAWGWRRWVADDPAAFFRALPQELQGEFLERVAASGTLDARRRVGAALLPWAAGLGPEAIGQASMVDRLLTLAAIEPDAYIPQLVRLVERADLEELRAWHMAQPDGAQARRRLVWFVEALAALSAFFDPAERLLRRLALAETESVANCATAIWGQLFLVHLSGTAIPFGPRLATLRRHLFGADAALAALALRALGAVFNPSHLRIATPAIVFGQVPPPEWAPADRVEAHAAYADAMALLRQVAGLDAHRAPARQITLDHLRWLLSQGFLPDLQAIFDPATLDPATRAELIDAIEEALYFDGREGSESPLAAGAAPHVPAIGQWLAGLRPTDLHERLVASVGGDPWKHELIEAEETWRANLSGLAGELLADREALARELPWLNSQGARASTQFGASLGRADRNGSLLADILAAAEEFATPDLASGYVVGLLADAPDHAARVNDSLDSLEGRAPELAYHLAAIGGERIRAFERTMRLVEASRLPTRYLRGVANPNEGPLTPDQFVALLARFVSAAEGGDGALADEGVSILAHRFDRDRRDGGASASTILDHPVARDQAWQLLALVEGRVGVSGHWWAELLLALAPADPSRATGLAVAGLLTLGGQRDMHAARVLVELAAEHPATVMDLLGAALLDPARAAYFTIHNQRGLVAALPTEIVLTWLRGRGPEAACRLARHLPPPHITEAGEAVVPATTEAVLAEYEADDAVFSAFRNSIHAGFAWYRDDIAAQHDQEADAAQRFLDHRLPRVREWAALEVADGRMMAERRRQMAEEYELDP